MKSVYLAGPISNINIKEAISWREYVKQELAKSGIEAYSPLRGKEEENDLGRRLLGNPKAFTSRDRHDILSCDLMLANLLDAERVSIGTVGEYGQADALRKPIITIMEKQGNVHDHPWIREVSGWVVETLDEGIYVARMILNT